MNASIEYPRRPTILSLMAASALQLASILPANAESTVQFSGTIGPEINASIDALYFRQIGWIGRNVLQRHERSEDAELVKYPLAGPDGDYSVTVPLTVTVKDKNGKDLELHLRNLFYRVSLKEVPDSIAEPAIKAGKIRSKAELEIGQVGIELVWPASNGEPYPSSGIATHGVIGSDSTVKDPSSTSPDSEIHTFKLGFDYPLNIGTRPVPGHDNPSYEGFWDATSPSLAIKQRHYTDRDRSPDDFTVESYRSLDFLADTRQKFYQVNFVLDHRPRAGSALR